MNQHHPRHVELSVCVIGRNEGGHLRACAASLLQLDTIGVAYETLFIDSASSDDSMRIAADCFDRAVLLAPSPLLNAGAARHVGTAQAHGDWILYLDGDMELSPEILPAIAALVRSGKRDEGLSAYTEHWFPDGTRQLSQYSGNAAGQPCRMYGGAVLLPRQKVLDAGNWSCELYAYEESELYARLLRQGVKVIWHDCRLVAHLTPKITPVRKLFGAIFPYRSYLGKKFYGAGQVTRLTLREGHFWQFARLKPESYLMLASLLLALLALPFLSFKALLLPLAVFGISAARVGLFRSISYACWQLQVPWGLFRTNTRFQPAISTIMVRTGAGR